MPQTRPQGIVASTIDSRKQSAGEKEESECLKSQFAVGIANKT